ncbi:MAG: arylesterase [Sphingomonadales bacterium]|nr:arylesterase [Sphingomonadales bacterium]
MRLAMIVLAAAATLALLGACRQNSPAPPAAHGIPAHETTPPEGPHLHVLALGDSLFAGYGLRPDQAYPERLEAALRAGGLAVGIANAGVSGDTSADGLARLDFTLANQPRTPDLVLISLGGNDMLRGLPPEQTRANLAAILARLRQLHIPVLLMGMLAAPNMGKAYASRFDAIYPALARRYHAALVPFFLAAVIDRPALRQADHIHPTAAGVDAIVAATRGAVTKALAERAPS